MKKQGNFYTTLGDKADGHVYDMIAYERMSSRKVASMFGIEKRDVIEIVRKLAPQRLQEINVGCVCISMDGFKLYMCSKCRAKKYEFLFKWNLKHTNALKATGKGAEGDEKFRGFIHLSETGPA